MRPGRSPSVGTAREQSRERSPAQLQVGRNDATPIAENVPFVARSGMVRPAMQPPSVHDALVKTAFSQIEHAEGELRLVLPAALVARIDFSTLSLRPGSFVDEALKERHSDLLYSVAIMGRSALRAYPSRASEPWKPRRSARSDRLLG